jgi:hypothetical protein
VNGILAPSVRTPTMGRYIPRQQVCSCRRIS